MVIRILLLLSVLALPGCAFFSRKPPLPKHASFERVPKPAADTDFAALVANADVIFFPRDRAASGSRSEPAALLFEALQQTAKPFALGWDIIDANQQQLLDELATKSGEMREEAIAGLQLIGSGRAREHCRAVLRGAQAPGLQHLALRCPALLLARVASSETLAPTEEKELPSGFKVPPDGLQGYAERFPTLRGLNERSLVASYRVDVARLQFAAERIVRHFRAAGRDSKLLVFSGTADLEAAEGVPYYVAQKLKLRQLVLGSNAPKVEPPKLLTHL